MARVEAPTITVDDSHGDRKEISRHPAFGQVAAHRVSGGANLYGSDFRHNAFMTITISRSEVHRNLNSDWYHPRDEIIEVALSEAQWATFVSSPNSGSGVPCTILAQDMNYLPALPDPTSRADQFSGELNQHLADTLNLVDAMIKAVDGMGLTTRKAETIKGDLRRIKMEMGSNLPFIAKRFGEHVEDTVEKAKSEIHGYMSQIVQRAGLSALLDGNLPLQIEHKTNDEDV